MKLAWQCMQLVGISALCASGSSSIGAALYRRITWNVPLYAMFGSWSISTACMMACLAYSYRDLDRVPFVQLGIVVMSAFLGEPLGYALVTKDAATPTQYQNAALGAGLLFIPLVFFTCLLCVYTIVDHVAFLDWMRCRQRFADEFGIQAPTSPPTTPPTPTIVVEHPNGDVMIGVVKSPESS